MAVLLCTRAARHLPENQGSVHVHTITVPWLVTPTGGRLASLPWKQRPADKSHLFLRLQPPNYLPKQAECKDYVAGEVYVAHFYDGSKPWSSGGIEAGCRSHMTELCLASPQAENTKPLSWFKDESRRVCFEDGNALYTFYFGIDRDFAKSPLDNDATRTIRQQLILATQPQHTHICPFVQFKVKNVLSEGA